MMEDWDGSPAFPEGPAWLPFADGVGCWDGGGVVEGLAWEWGRGSRCQSSSVTKGMKG